MRGLFSLLRWDFVMQYRYGFWMAGIGVTLMWAAVLRPLSPEYLEIWLPCVLYFDIGVIGLMFIAGMLFFERRQGAIDALVVTPVSTPVWLMSKLASLVVLATVVACALVLLTIGVSADWLRIVPAFALVAAFYTLIGFLVATRFGSVSSFLALFGLLGVPLGLPIFAYFGIWAHPIQWVNPAYSTLELLRLAFQPGSGPELATAALITFFWIALAFPLGVRMFHRRVSWRRGAA